jgi:hypothetical protein
VNEYYPYDTRIKDGVRVRITHTDEIGVIDGEPYYEYEQASIKFSSDGGNRVYSFKNFEVLEDE